MKEDGNLVYVVLQNAGSSNGDIMPMTGQHGDVPPYWLAYFTVPSCEDAIAKVRDLGGYALARPLAIEASHIAGTRSPGCCVRAIRGRD
jgi:uncharacterized protein